MTVTRRNVLSMSAALPFMGLLPKIAVANVSLGDATLTTVSDGSLVLPANFIFEQMPKDELAPILTEFELGPDRLTPRMQSRALPRRNAHGSL